MSTETQSVQPKDLADLLSVNERKVSVDHDGYKIELRVYPVTRLMRNQALELAAIAYQEKYGKPGFLPTVFERELAIRLIKWWNIPKPPSLGWDMLPLEVGDKISEAIGTADVLKSLKGIDSKAVQDAKN